MCVCACVKTELLELTSRVSNIRNLNVYWTRMVLAFYAVTNLCSFKHLQSNYYLNIYLFVFLSILAPVAILSVLLVIVVVVVVVEAFSSCAWILGECSIIHFLHALFFFFF